MSYAGIDKLEPKIEHDVVNSTQIGFKFTAVENAINLNTNHE